MYIQINPLGFIVGLAGVGGVHTPIVRNTYFYMFNQCIIMGCIYMKSNLWTMRMTYDREQKLSELRMLLKEALPIKEQPTTNSGVIDKSLDISIRTVKQVISDRQKLY